MKISPRAGQPTRYSDLIEVTRLINDYYSGQPNPEIPEQRVVFGTSGHRGASIDHSFNEWHILAITQAICLYRRENGIDGPLFLGIDTHALSRSAQKTALGTC